MKKYFDYLRPKNVEEAIELKAEYGSLAKFWAGGTDMVLQWKAGIVSLDFCIDLTHIKSMRYIKIDGDSLHIGAMATLNDVDLQSELSSLNAALGETVRLMCTQQTRTIATVGGNLCNSSPSADLSSLLTAMGAQVVLQSPSGKRTLSLDEFQTGVRKVALNDDELLVEIIVPDVNTTIAAHYNRVARTVVDIALVNSSACLKVNKKGIIVKAGIAIGAVATTVLRVTKAEELLIGKSLAEAAGDLAVEAGKHAVDKSSAITDIRASSEYRTDMIAVLTQRAIRHCVNTLGGSK